MNSFTQPLHFSQNLEEFKKKIQAIVRTLARWHAILTKAQALELLALLNCPPFQPQDWNEPPLDKLTLEEQALSDYFETSEEQSKDGQVSLTRPHSLAPTTALSDIAANNLPVELTSFVGRAKEISEIKQLLLPTSRQTRCCLDIESLTTVQEILTHYG